MNAAFVLAWCWLLFFASLGILFKVWPAIKRSAPERNFDRFLVRILACGSAISLLIALYESYRFWWGA